jgi:holo-[acyl-carrier protein] synthase
MKDVGLDLLEIDRLERALQRRPRLAQRLFTAAEREHASRWARPARHLAARFCAKEAVAKALRLSAWSFQEIEIVATGRGPEVRVTGSVADRVRQLGVRVHVSLTHGREIAAAVAALEPLGEPPTPA